MTKERKTELLHICNPESSTDTRGKQMYEAALELIRELEESEKARKMAMQMYGWSDDHDGNCYWCGERTCGVSAHPGEWPIMLCHEDDPGVSKHHHERCLYERLDRLKNLEAEIKEFYKHLTLDEQSIKDAFDGKMGEYKRGWYTGVTEYAQGWMDGKDFVQPAMRDALEEHDEKI